MSALRRSLTLVVGLALAAMWIWAVQGKLVHAESAYELVATLVQPRWMAQLTLAVLVGAEAALAAAIVLRLVDGLVPSLVLLGVFSLGLWRIDVAGGELLPCGCFGMTDATVRDSLLRNLWLAGGIVLVLGIDLWLRRRAAQSERSGAAA